MTTLSLLIFFKKILKNSKPEGENSLIYLSDNHEELVCNGLGGLIIKVYPHKLLKSAVSDSKSIDVVMAWKIICH